MYDNYDTSEHLVSEHEVDFEYYRNEDEKRLQNNAKIASNLLFVLAWIFFFPVMALWYIYEYLNYKE